MHKWLLTNTAGKKSITLTVFVLGSIVVNIKLLLSGMTFGSVTMSPFTGSDYSLSMASLGAIYVLRRNSGPEYRNSTGEK